MKVHSNSFDPSVVCVARIINVPLVKLSTKWDYFYISSSCHLPISHSALNRWLHYDSLMKNNVQNGRYSMSVEANCCIHISKLQTHFHSSQHSFHSSKLCDAKPGTQSLLVPFNFLMSNKNGNKVPQIKGEHSPTQPVSNTIGWRVKHMNMCSMVLHMNCNTCL